MLVMCVSDTNSLLGAGRSAESVVPTDGMTVNMLKSYQESDICGKNDQQLQQAMEHVHEKEHRGGRERNSPAAYATNCLWQVLSSGLIRKHMHIHVYHVFVSDVYRWHSISNHYCERPSQLLLAGQYLLLFSLSSTSLSSSAPETGYSFSVGWNCILQTGQQASQ